MPVPPSISARNSSAAIDHVRSMKGNSVMRVQVESSRSRMLGAVLKARDQFIPPSDLDGT